MITSPIDGDTWKALSDATRRGILDLLRVEPANTGTLCDAFPELGRHAVIRHLKLLEDAGFVRVEARGRERINHLNPVPLQRIYERWMRPYEQLWASSVLTLSELAESRQQNLERDQTRRNQGENDMSETDVRVLTIEVEHTVNASPSTVWQTLIDEKAAWWTFVEDGGAVSLDPRLGGFMINDLGNGNAFTYGVIRGLHADKELIMDGTFGMPGAIHGQLRVRLEEKVQLEEKVRLEELGGTQTKVSFAHEVIGAVAPGGEIQHVEGWTMLIANLANGAEAREATS